MLEAGWPVVFAVSGAAEVTVVVGVGRPPGRVVGHCEGDVVGGGEVAVNGVDRAPPAPPPRPVSAGNMRGCSEHKVVATGTGTGVGQL